MNKVLLSLVAVASLTLSPAHAAVLNVVNGSFEYPANGTEWGPLPGISANNGWANPTATGNYVINKADGFWFAHAADGSYLLNTPEGTTTQDLNTTLGLGDVVSLTFSIAQTLTEYNGGDVSYGQGTITAEILSGSTVIGHGTFSATAPQGDWATFTVNGLVTTPGDISIAFVNNGDAPWLDNVSASYQQVVVPEPSTYALMLAGLGALAFVARRRASTLL